MGLLMSLLLSGCAQRSNDTYCDLAGPMYFENQNIINHLIEKDKQLLTDIITHNETWEKICNV